MAMIVNRTTRDQNGAMSKWIFEPGHTAAMFSARHMMVSDVRGHFKNVDGTLEIDDDDPCKVSVEVKIRAADIWTGDEQRDAHLRAVDFLDVENHPEITFSGSTATYTGENDICLAGKLTIRGVTQDVELHVRKLGEWDTPFWEDGEDKGPLKRAGFSASTRINRLDFGVRWNDKLDRGGVVVSNDVDITIDVEALKQA